MGSALRVRARLQQGYLYSVAKIRSARAAPSWCGVRLLGYHRVSTDNDPLATAPERFSRQMQWLTESGYQVVSLARALSLLDEPRLDQPYVALTFDDGYCDNAQHALPVLRRLGLPATMFIITAAVDGEARLDWYASQPPLLSWDEIGSLDREGLISFGAHTRTHPYLPRVSSDQAWQEIEGSKLDLEQRLGHAVDAFCYPAGLYGSREAALVERAGFRVAVTCDPGVNTPQTDRFRLRRVLVDRTDGSWLFSAKLAGRLDSRDPLRRFLHARRSAAHA